MRCRARFLDPPLILRLILAYNNYFQGDIRSMPSSSKALRFGLLICASSMALGLGGCVQPLNGPLDGDMGGTQVTDTESLLEAEGTWHLVEQESSPTPLQQHMDAREDVNTAKMSRNKMYVNKAEQARRGETVHYRLLRMEREIAGLRQDFDKLLPPLSNLIVSDAQLDTTIKSIQAQKAANNAAMMSGGNASAAPVTMNKMAPAKKMGAVKPASSSVKSSALPDIKSSYSGPLAVTDVRLGVHPDKTRMVLDVSGETKFSMDLDNNEKLLLIDLPNTSWAASAAKKIAGNPYVAGYSTQKSASGGTTLVVELKKPVRIAGSAALKPRTNPVRGHRIFIDLASR